MKRRLLLILLIVMLPGKNSWAGRLLLTTRPDATISVAPNFDHRGNVTSIDIHPLFVTGEQYAGRAVLKIKNGIFHEYSRPPYDANVPINQNFDVKYLDESGKDVKAPIKLGKGSYVIEYIGYARGRDGRDVKNGKAFATARVDIVETLDKNEDREASSAIAAGNQAVIQQLTARNKELEQEIQRLRSLEPQVAQKDKLIEEAKTIIIDLQNQLDEARKQLQTVRQSPEGVIVVTGRPGESVTVDCKRDGEVVRQFSFSFVEHKLITDFRIPVTAELVVSAIFTLKDGRSITLEKSTTGQPMNLTPDHLTLYFASFPYAKTVKGGSK